MSTLEIVPVVLAEPERAEWLCVLRGFLMWLPAFAFIAAFWGAVAFGIWKLVHHG